MSAFVKTFLVEESFVHHAFQRIGSFVMHANAKRRGR